MEVVTYEKQFMIGGLKKEGESLWNLPFPNNIEILLIISTDQKYSSNCAGFHLEFKKLPILSVWCEIYSKITLISKYWKNHEKRFQIYPNIRSGLSDFITKDELFDEANGYLVNDTLTLRIKIKLINEIEKFQQPPEITENKKTIVHELFQAKNFTDVTIKIKDKTVKAHKILLAEFSSVFRKLLQDLENIRMTSKFSYNIKQILPVPNLGNHTILELKDLQFETLEVLLNFIYGQRLKVVKENAKLILKAAKSYKIEGLVKICEKYYFENLTVGNALETLKLASDFCVIKLEIECNFFIEKNIKQIVSDEKWDEFVTESPKLFYDIFKSCAIYNSNSLQRKYAISNFVQVKKSKDNENICNLSQDLGRLYDESLFTDVELIVQGKVLKAHKGILSSRSTVFKAMFSHDTLESSKNRVIIEDFDFETIQELLEYIYSEKVENLKDVPLNLFRAADKYNLLKLKEMCANSMVKNMTDENVGEILDVADMHSCTELKQEAIAFMARNTLHVIGYGKCEKIIQQKPQLFNEIFKDWVKNVF